MILNKEQILTADDLPSVIVNVPEWGGDVKIRALTAHDKDQCSLAIYNEQQRTGVASNYKSQFVAASIVDENNKLLFTPSEVDELGKKNAFAIERVYNAVTKLNLLDSESQEEAKKNLQAT